MVVLDLEAKYRNLKILNRCKNQRCYTLSFWQAVRI